MNNLLKRNLLFLIGCIGTRTLFVLLAKYLDKKYLPYMGYLALLIASGFTIIYFTGIRDTGAEVFGDKIWWNNLRPIHALLYFTFAYLAITQNNYAWVPLLFDVLFGLFAFFVLRKIDPSLIDD
jgi:hypothetical protein